MKTFLAALCCVFPLSSAASAQSHVEQAPDDRRRIVILTDIENEPDDAQSTVRFLTYSNQWDVEGIVTTTSIHMQDRLGTERMRGIIAAYGKVQPNLLRHASGYPTAGHLLSVLREGQPSYGMAAVGEGKDTPGSNLLVEEIERDDARPLWVLVWGGPNTLAQALWSLRNRHGEAEANKLLDRLRVYTISDQDDSGPWIRKTFPELFYIASPGMHAGGAYHHSTWIGIAGDRFHGRFTGPDFSIVDNPWLDKNIRAKGPLGAQYPHTEFIMEGDTPSLLYLIDNGLGDPEHPDWGSWGGRYEFYTPRWQKWHLAPETRPFWSDAQDEVMGVDGFWHTTNQATIWRWREAYQNDFAARMDWTVSDYADANHPPIVTLDMPSSIDARSGQEVALHASATDPDGDALDYQWFYYPEAGTFTVSSARTGNPVEVIDADQPIARFTVPTDRVLRKGTMHFIVAVTDHGTPQLTRYQRVIVNIE